MAILLPVGAKADDRSFKAIGDQATKFFSDVGKSGASAFTKDFTDAVSSQSPKVQKAFDKIRDSIGQVAAEQAKLNDLQNKGVDDSRLVTQSERLERAKRAESRAIREAGDAYDQLSSKAGAVQNAFQGFVSGSLSANVPWLNASHIDQAAEAIGGISTKALAAATGVTAVGVAAGAAFKQLYDVGAMWDDIGDTITGKTGIMGDQLDSIMSSVQTVGKNSAIPWEAISNSAAGVAQNLHLTGDEATYMLQKLADVQQVAGQAIDTRGLGKAFRLFDITDVQSEVSAIEQLLAASQSTLIPINQLVDGLTNAGKAGKEAGLDMQQTIGLLVTLEDAGVDFEKSGSSLSIALKNWSKEGRDANQALAETITQIQHLIETGNSPAALQLAQQTFGRGYIDFFNAIKDGTLDVDNLTAALTKLGDATGGLDAQKKSTEDWHEQWQKITHTLSSVFKPVADTVFTGINSELMYMTGHLTEATDGVNNLATSINSIKPDALANALGLPALPGGPGTGAAIPLPTTKPTTPTTGLAPNFYKDWYPVPDKDKKGGPKLPDAPVLPYDTTLPQGFGNLPQTSEILGAENSYMDARHTLAEKQARVTQLEQSGIATADEVQKAKNDVVQAEQAQQQTELQLSNARQNLFEKSTKQLNKQVSDLGEIGAKLDSDFGISKGLAGIADNLVRFVGNLIAAPELLKLNALANAPGQAQGGFGLMGVLGAQGAFGPQYTYEGQQAGSISGSSASSGQTGLSAPSAALPGESARDFAHRVMMPFWQQQGFTVGDHAADKYGEHQHGALDVMVPSIAAGQQVLQQVLSDPNVYGAIFNNQTYGYGHGLTPQDYTAGHTGDPNQDHQNHVHVWYKPGDPGDISPSGAPISVGANGGSFAPSSFSSSTGGASFPIPLPVTIVGGMPGMPFGAPGSGSPASGQGSGPAPGPTGGLSAQQWGQIAGAEAGGNWQLNSGNGYSGGLQFDPNTWSQYGGTQFAPQAWQATPEQQMQIGDRVLAGQGTGAWPTTSANHPEWFQPGLPNLPAGQGGSGYTGLGGPGIGQGIGPQGLALGGPQQGPTTIGGIAPPSGTGKGGIGMTEGGILDTAMGLAASGVPGLGQAAQTGMKLANRAIQFAGQAAGIGVQGLMETWLPTGGSQLANNNWFTRIIGGLAGAAPALPNIAGKSAAQDAQKQNPQAQMGPNGPQMGDTNITVNNNRATEDGTGKDIAWHQQQAALPAGMP